MSPAVNNFSTYSASRYIHGNVNDTIEILKQLRVQIMNMSSATGAAHLGSALSCVDMIASLYYNILDIDPKNPNDPDRDRFILSKGHAATALYSVLAFKGFFDKSILSEYSQDGGRLPEHPGPKCVPGIEAATGSLGHGLCIGAGIALAAKISKKNYLTYVIISDGECNEGSTWEAALFAPAKKLDNLIVMVDYNKWQATGRSNEVLGLHPMIDKWKSFGWNVYEIDGNNVNQIVDTLSKIKSSIRTNQANGKPSIIVCHTVKGKGASFMEDDNNWHYRAPTPAEIDLVKKELGVE